MYSLENLSPATKWHIFSQNFSVNPDWKYYQNITWKKIATYHHPVMILLSLQTFLKA